MQKVIDILTNKISDCVNTRQSIEKKLSVMDYITVDQLEKQRLILTRNNLMQTENECLEAIGKLSNHGI